MFFVKVEGVSYFRSPILSPMRFMFTSIIYLRMQEKFRKNFLLSSKFLPPTTQSFLKGYYFTEIGKFEMTFFKKNYLNFFTVFTVL